MIIKIPIRIVSESNKTGEHWSKKSKRHKIQKLLVRSYLQQHEKPTQFPCFINMVRYAPRKLDVDDNLRTGFKWIKDAISEYLLDCHVAGRADDDPRLVWGYDQIKTKGKEYYITISIRTGIESPSIPILSPNLLDHLLHPIYNHEALCNPKFPPQ